MAAIGKSLTNALTFGLARGKSRAPGTPFDPMTLLTQSPKVGDDATEAQQIAAARRKRQAAGASAPATRNGTLLTGPAGVTAPATTERKTLLGM